ncbi:MAG: hypothetical protein ACYTGH_08970 [Planctomycetota bacterium]|jgi:hypothetical protein
MKTFLLSYPRSGNSWVRYFVEHVSGRPTAGCVGNAADVALCRNRLDPNPLAHVDEAAAPILHKSHGEALENGASNRLLLLTRNPSICIRRHVGGFSLLEVGRYIRILDRFNGWNGQRHLVRYEDLTTRPTAVFLQIAEFLSLDHQAALQFSERLEDHRAQSIRLYSDPSSGIAPKGNSETGGTQVGMSKPGDKALMRAILVGLCRRSYLDMFTL